MCGIVFSLSKGEPQDAILARLAEVNERRGPDYNSEHRHEICGYHLRFYASVLHLRGDSITKQPLRRDGNILLWNGEIYDGLEISNDENDGSVLLMTLAGAANRAEVLAAFRSLRGEYAFVFYHRVQKTIYFGRDCLGRRSLLIHQDVTVDTKSITLASTSEGEDFDEVAADGIYSISLTENAPMKIDHETWSYNHDTALRLPYDRVNNSLSTEMPPVHLDKQNLPVVDSTMQTAIDGLIHVLDSSVRRRIISIPDYNEDAPLGVLFSGGIDCMVLAALADRYVRPDRAIDLLNVAFENPRTQKNGKGSTYDVPDRKTGRAGVEELKRLAPSRQWNFVEIDVSYFEATAARRTIRQRMYPNDSVMDESIAMAFWFAAAGVGATSTCEAYTSRTKVLFSGLGADEQLGGYSRHRNAFERGGWSELVQEIRLDVERISTRNLGRDDRIISDHGKETRFPFLDEEVVRYLSALPIHLKMDMRFGRGIGDKMLLRHAARQLGLPEASMAAKRAIQFGARTAKMEDSKERGDMKAKALR